jgi:hypothetical protein
MSEVASLLAAAISKSESIARDVEELLTLAERLKWKKGLIPSEGVRLVADQVFHDECWDKYWAKYDTKRVLPEALAKA